MKQCNAFQAFFSKFIIVCFVIVASTISVSRLFITVDHQINFDTHYHAFVFRFFDFISLLLVIVIFLLIHLCKKVVPALSKRAIELIAFCFTAAVGISALLLFHNQIFLDSSELFTIAETINQSSFKGLDPSLMGYMQRFPFQYAYVLFIRIYLSLFNNNAETLMKLTQIIIYAISNVFVIKTIFLKKRATEAGYLFILLLIIWPMPILMCNYLYGFSLGLSFTQIAIYYFFKGCSTKSFKRIMVSVIIQIIAVIFKENFKLIFIVMILYYLMTCNGKFVKNLLCTSVLILGMLITTPVNQITAYAIDKVSLSSGESLLYYTVMGGVKTGEEKLVTRAETIPGAFDGYVSAWDYSATDNSKNDQIMKEDLNSQFTYFIQNPSKSWNFYSNKFLTTFNDCDYMLKTYLNSYNADFERNALEKSLDNGNLAIAVDVSGNLFTLLLFIGLVGTLYSFNRRAVFYHLIILGGFAYLMLLETKSFYFYPFLTLAMPMAAIGLQAVSTRFESISFKEISKQKKGLIAFVLIGIVVVGIFYSKQNMLKPMELNDNTTHYEYHTFTQNIVVGANDRCDLIEIHYFGYLNSDKLNVTFSNDSSHKQNYSIKLNTVDQVMSIVPEEGAFLPGNYQLTVFKAGNSSDGFGFITKPEDHVVLDYYQLSSTLWHYYPSSYHKDNDINHMYYYSGIIDLGMNNK